MELSVSFQLMSTVFYPSFGEGVLGSFHVLVCLNFGANQSWDTLLWFRKAYGWLSLTHYPNRNQGGGNTVLTKILVQSGKERKSSATCFNSDIYYTPLEFTSKVSSLWTDLVWLCRVSGALTQDPLVSFDHINHWYDHRYPGFLYQGWIYDFVIKIIRSVDSRLSSY